MIFDLSLEEKDTITTINVARIVQELICCCNTDLSLKLFSDKHWKFTFKALEYTSNNYDQIKDEKSHEYLNFLEKETRMRVIDQEALFDGFDDLVKLRFRVMFFKDFVQDAVTSEQMLGHLQMVRKFYLFFLTFFS